MYMSATKIDFAEWLRETIEARGWNQNKLAQVSGISAAQIGRIMSGERQAGPDACRAFADALGLPPEIVFRRAGLLPPVDNAGERAAITAHLVDQLPVADQEAVIAFARQRLETAKRAAAVRGELGKLEAALNLIDPNDTRAIMDVIEKWLLDHGAKRIR